MRAALCLVAMLIAAPAAAQRHSVILTPPSRDFGYFLGDKLTSTAVVTVAPDAVLDRRSVPQAGPVARSIDIRSVTLAEESTAAGRRVSLRITYQSFFDPPEAARTGVPGYSLTFTQGGARFDVAVPGWGFAASPFRHTLLPVSDAAALRADHPAVRLDTRRPTWFLAAGLTAAALAALALAKLRGWLPALRWRASPFAAACRRVARLSRGAADAPARREALLALHRAFDATAGRNLLADDLDVFLTQHPRFAELRVDIERFFALSRRAFFAADPDEETWPMQALAKLSRALRRAERMA